jgi:hypothetical protein
MARGRWLAGLHAAARSGDCAEIECILSGLRCAAFLVKARCDAGWTALHHACHASRSAAAIRLLLEHGADANARTMDGKGRTPLVRTCR